MQSTNKVIWCLRKVPIERFLQAQKNSHSGGRNWKAQTLLSSEWTTKAALEIKNKQQQQQQTVPA